MHITFIVHIVLDRFESILRCFKTFWKGTIMLAFFKIFNNYCCKYLKIFSDEFCWYIIRLCSFLGVRVFDLFKYKRFCYFLETKIRVLYLIHMIFDGRNTRMMFLLFDNSCQRNCIRSSLPLYASIPRSGTMLKKNSLKVLASAFSDGIISRFSNKKDIVTCFDFVSEYWLYCFLKHLCVSNSKFS